MQEEGVVLLGEGDVVGSTEGRIAQRGEAQLGDAVLRRREQPQRASIAEPRRRGRRVGAAVLEEARGRRLARGSAERAEEERLVGWAADGAVVDALAVGVARRSQVCPLARLEHARGEARLRSWGDRGEIVGAQGEIEHARGEARLRSWGDRGEIVGAQGEIEHARGEARLRSWGDRGEIVGRSWGDRARAW